MNKFNIYKAFLTISFASLLLLFGCDTSDDNNGMNGNENGSENGGSHYTDTLSFSIVNNNTFKQEAGVFSGGSIYSNIYDVSYGNGRFVAVGIAGQMAYSSDGVTWTSVENTGFGNRYRISNVCFGNGVFVASGTWSNVIVGGSLTTIGRIVYSNNGVNWSAADTDNFDSTKITDITYGNGKFLAITNTGQIIYSSNGRTWTVVTDSTFGSSAISGIAYGDGRFIAVTSSANRIAYSTDGVIWAALVSSSFNGIIYGKDKFLAWGNGTIATSTDGTSWIPIANISTTGITYGAEKIVLWNGSNISFSLDDGITWIQTESNFTETINNIVYGADRFVAVGGNFGKITYSNNQKL